jgi:hypothetical protein
MFTRRTWLRLNALIPVLALPATSVAQPLQRRVKYGFGVRTFDQLKASLAALPNRQELGSPTTICEQTGEEYVEIFAAHMARPGDEKVAEEVVASWMQRQIYELFTDRVNGTTYWRVPLDFSIDSSQVIIEYRDDGPSIDVLTDRRCVMDRNWKRVAAYCCLTVAKE